MSSFPQGSVPPGQPPWPPAAPQTSKQSRWPTIVAVVIALIAIVLAVVGWFRPITKEAATPSQPAYTDQQVADAKAKVCAAYGSVHEAVGASMGRDKGTDPAMQLAVAVDARQALLAGAVYLSTILDQQPATPSELATAVRKISSLFEELTVKYTSGANNADLAPSLSAGDQVTLEIEQICK